MRKQASELGAHLPEEAVKAGYEGAKPSFEVSREDFEAALADPYVQETLARVRKKYGVSGDQPKS